MSIVLSTDETRWDTFFADEKMPGSADPIPGKCGAKLRDKRLRELDINRYCTKKAGMGTTHLGEGTCKWHLGSTIQHSKTAIQTQMGRELVTISEKLGEPVPMDHPEVEAWRLTSKAKTWSVIIEQKMDELNSLVNTDEAGIEHTRALIEIMERAWDRLQGMLEFALKYDLRKRIIELEEHQARLVGTAFMQILLSPEMNCSETQIETGRRLFASKMNELGPDMEPSWASDTDIVDAEIVD